MPKSWIIGAASDCDLVVDLPKVSGRHCRLTLDGGRYTLEDLGSTNGTFVDGARISVPVVVTQANRITLGVTTTMPWPKSGAATAARGKELSIGRDPENDFVVPLETVSGRHARLVWAGRPGAAEIEDLGSSNGTAVGSPERKAKRAIVTLSDVVYLGSHPVPASHLLARVDPSASKPLNYAGGETLLGSGGDCDLPLPLPTVSTRHARLFRSSGRVMVEDLNSTSGTFVNGRRVVGSAPVAEGDFLSLGTHTFRLVFARPAPTRPETAAWLLPIEEPAIPTPTPAAPISAAPVPSPMVNLALRVGSTTALSLPAGIAASLLSRSGNVPAAFSCAAVSVVLLGICLAVFGLGPYAKRPGLWWPTLGTLAASALLQSLIVVGILIGLGGSKSPGVASLPIAALAGLAGLAIGVFAVAATPEGSPVWPIVPVALVFLVLFGGQVWPLPQMPAPARTLAAFAPTRWAFEGLLILESKPDPGGDDPVEPYFPVGTERMGPTADATALGLMLAGWAAATAIMVWLAPAGSRRQARPASSNAP